MKQPLLKVKSLDVAYDRGKVIRDMSMGVHQGEILGIVGESGSGKSTLLKALMGLLGNNGCVCGGSIFYREKNLLKMTAEELREIRGSEIGMVFQNCVSTLCPIRTIGDQVYESISQHKKVTRNYARNKSLELLKKFRLHDGERILKSYPFELSGGMNQRVGIMMAMLLEPSLLLADEPTSALDVTVQRQIINEMMHIRDNFGTAIIVVTHNISLVERMADQILVMQKGTVMEYGKKEDVILHPQNQYTAELLQAVPRLKRGDINGQST